MHILVTINKNYIEQLKIMLYSLKCNHQNQSINVYLLHHNLCDEDISDLKKCIEDQYLMIIALKLDYQLNDVYITKRYPCEIYDRLFATLYLPKDLERILYLDPDIIVKGDLNKLYNTDFQDKLFVGASHTNNFLNYINKKRLNLKEDVVYLNTGVLLMNLNKLRHIIDPTVITQTIRSNHYRLILPDQDIITILYGNQIIEVDAMTYNLSDRILNIANLLNHNLYTKQWIDDNVKIIHYCGRNKPWNKYYLGILDDYYHHYLKAYKESLKSKN